MKEDLLAVIPTRGDVNFDEALAPLHRMRWPVRIWNNKVFPCDLKVMGRYMAVGVEPNAVIYTQDDDCVVLAPGAIVSAREPGQIVCNMPREFQDAYADKPTALVGFGACFTSDDVSDTFGEYFRAGFALDECTLREADRIFTGLNRHRIKFVDVPKDNLPHATWQNRLWKQPNHGTMHKEAIRRVQMILDVRRHIADALERDARQSG